MKFPIEAAVRTGYSRLLVSLFGVTPDVPLPDWKARPYRLLFIRDDGLGDLILTVSIMKAIAEVSPHFTIDVVAGPSNAAYARSLPFVNEVIVHRRGWYLASWRVWRELARRKYDVVIDCRVAINNVNKQTMALILASRAPWRIGITGRRNDRVYNVRVPRPDPFNHWMDVMVALGQPFGIKHEGRDWKPKLPISDAERAAADRTWDSVGTGRPRVLLNLYANQPDRLWPTRQFAELAPEIRKRLPNATVIIPTMPGGDKESDRIAALVGGAAAAVALGLDPVMAVTATADLIISPDTSITVMAATWNRPILALMRAESEKWAPYYMTGRMVFSDSPLSLRELPTARVVAALEEVIAEQGWR
jgi:ADP-heptose:LPS heptosyltransferase